MKTHVLILSKTFPKWHPKAGQPTYFKEKMHNGLLWNKGMNIGYSQTPSYAIPGDIQLKLHTLRGNYERWEKIFEEIDRGEACLVLKQWSGVPYRSKQETIAVLTKEDGIGLQKLDLKLASFSPFYIEVDRIDEERRTDTIHVGLLANNDGLSLTDWQFWFEKYDLSKPLAIIHFTSFRY